MKNQIPATIVLTPPSPTAQNWDLLSNQKAEELKAYQETRSRKGNAKKPRKYEARAKAKAARKARKANR